MPSSWPSATTGPEARSAFLTAGSSPPWASAWMRQDSISRNSSTDLNLGASPKRSDQAARSSNRSRRRSVSTSSSTLCITALVELVAPLAVDFGGVDDVAFLLERPGHCAAHRVRLPAGGLHQLFDGGAARFTQARKQQVELGLGLGCGAVRHGCSPALAASSPLPGQAPRRG